MRDSSQMRAMRPEHQTQEHGMMQLPLGIPESRAGSGTSWLPDSSPMHAHHVMVSDWTLMLHYQVFGTYDKQLGARGDDQINSINWGMLMASHQLAGGRFQARGMMSAEPWTVGSSGYPLLLQSGESKGGVPLHDHQHPHDLFMELSALYERSVGRNLAFQVYLAPVGAPALGPVAYPHRPSAESDPLAPIGHHWQDATHISFGVITAGFFSRQWKLEGSIFNGREPDENRTNFDYQGRSLDSYAGRLTWNPNSRWSFSGSYGFLKSPEELRPDESIHRVAASALYGRSLGSRGQWSTALVYGANKSSDEPSLSNSALIETNLDLDGKSTIFGRAEYARKSAFDLQVNAPAFAGDFDVATIAAGYARQLAMLGPTRLGIGVRGAINVVPDPLRATYGSRTPKGFAFYLRLSPSRMSMGGMDMKGMQGMAPGYQMPAEALNTILIPGAFANALNRLK